MAHASQNEIVYQNISPRSISQMCLNEMRKKTHSIYTRSRFSWEFAYQSAENGSVCMRQLGKRSSTHSFHKIFFQTQIGKKNQDFYFELRITKLPMPLPSSPFSNKWIENNSKLCRAETSGTKGYRNKQRAIKKYIEGKNTPTERSLLFVWCSVICGVSTHCAVWNLQLHLDFKGNIYRYFARWVSLCGGPFCTKGVNMERRNRDKKGKVSHMDRYLHVMQCKREIERAKRSPTRVTTSPRTICWSVIEVMGLVT